MRLYLQIIQHWKPKTLSHQHSENNEFPQPFIGHFSLTQSSVNTISSFLNENLLNGTGKNSSKDDLLEGTDESENSTMATKQGSMSILQSYKCRRLNLKTNSILIESFQSQLLVARSQNVSNETDVTIKNRTKALPVFLPPK